MTSTENKRVKRTQRDDTLGFKLAVVEQAEKGDFTYKQAQKAYGIQGRSTLLVWLIIYCNLDWSNPESHTLISKSKETRAQKITRLEQGLEQELETLRLRDIVKDKMISDHP